MTGAGHASDPQLETATNLGRTSRRMTTSDTANRPPGFRTRNLSRKTASLSTERLITQFEMITSTDRSGSGITSSLAALLLVATNWSKN
jgi:hypothetical protein